LLKRTNEEGIKTILFKKLNDAETENAETQVWLDFSLAFKYISAEKHLDLTVKNDEVARLIVYMINNPDKFM
jgi:four helix bundle protein